MVSGDYTLYPIPLYHGIREAPTAVPTVPTVSTYITVARLAYTDIMIFNARFVMLKGGDGSAGVPFPLLLP